MLSTVIFYVIMVLWLMLPVILLPVFATTQEYMLALMVSNALWVPFSVWFVSLRAGRENKKPVIYRWVVVTHDLKTHWVKKIVLVSLTDRDHLTRFQMAHEESEYTRTYVV